MVFARVGQPGSGKRCLGYGLAYCAARVGLEFLRGDTLRGLHFGSLVSTSQALALVLLCFCLWGLARPGQVGQVGKRSRPVYTG